VTGTVHNERRRLGLGARIRAGGWVVAVMVPSCPADTRELLGWILSFGRGVKVVRPAELRDRVRAEALALSRH
jgi:predicted DNA-binding transcriptional regulator YafY